VDPTIGVLALQGAFSAHEDALRGLGVATRQVRTPADLAAIDALVMPGGESTTMSRLLDTSGLFDDLKSRLSDGMPVFGTCAGMILLAADVLDGRPDQRSFGIIDITVQRNGYGRQVDSFETDMSMVSTHPSTPSSSGHLRWSPPLPRSRCWRRTTKCPCWPARGMSRSPRSTRRSPRTHDCTRCFFTTTVSSA
jgi:pyridoxal 5'-phosphate synthase glutaminase subunit Pdx2